MKDVLAVVLAGGRGSRLDPMTRDRAKPAVPFGGQYRIIDFSLSNCLNSGIRKILLLTQYKAISLDRHIHQAWRKFFCRELGEFIDVIPPQQRIDDQWYQGTADAVYQNIYSLEKTKAETIVILAGDHIYQMDYSQMVEYHQKKQADLTIGALPVTVQEAKSFGVMQIDDNNQIVGFDEKPDHPKTIPGQDDTCLASMGIYVFDAKFLYEQLCLDAVSAGSSRDFGKNIIPGIIQEQKVFAFPFQDQNGQKAYWRDVGTVEAYYEANMDLIKVDPALNLYQKSWPIRSLQNTSPPPKFVFGSNCREEDPRMGTAVDSIVCNGAVISGGKVIESLVGQDCRIESFSSVEKSILFDGVVVGKGARIRKAIIDKNVVVPDNVSIGYDLEADRKAGYKVCDSGIVVIAKEDRILGAPAEINAGSAHTEINKSEGELNRKPACPTDQPTGSIRSPFYQKNLEKDSSKST